MVPQEPSGAPPTYLMYDPLLKNRLNYLKYSIMKCFFKEYNRLLYFLKKLIFFTSYNCGKFKS